MQEERNASRFLGRSVARRLFAWLLQFLMVILISIALLESLVAFGFRYPGLSLIPLPLLRYLHVRFDRDVIQVKPDCARYDDYVTYTLKPGRCTFSSREFSNEYMINSLGVRDDEESLVEPETVILGDSMAMGWGVDQQSTFAALFEKASGIRTLNAAVSSFGTVRELRMLQRVDRSKLKNVVIQYNENDFQENVNFVERPPFTTLTKEEYERTVSDQAELLRYLPGKYTLNILVQLQSMVRARVQAQEGARPVSTGRQADIFVRVIEQSPVDLSRFRLTVMSVDPSFLAAVKRVAAKSSAPWVQRADYLDVSSIRRLDGAYYTLDDHPTALGHRVVSGQLFDHLHVTPQRP